MAYGTIKVDTITFTDGGIDKSVAISGLVQNPTFTGNVTVTGTVSGNTVQGQTISGVTATGTTANFVSGVFTTQISGATVTGTTANFTSGNFTNISGGTHTITSGVFALGTAANPSISFTSDPNTGIYSPGADQVAISTNGTGRLFVDASGNVQIGSSTSTGARVDITGSSDIFSFGSTSRRLYAWADSGGVSLLTGDTQTGNGFYIDELGSNIRFWTGSTERMRLDSSGRLGLGTSSVSQKLQIAAGNVQIDSGYGFIWDNSTTGIYGSGSPSFLQFYTGNAERMRVTSTGVGIGVTGPQAPLHSSKGGTLPTVTGTETGIFQWNGVTGHTSSVAIVGGSGASSELYFGDGDDIDVGFIRYEHPNNALVFATNTAERARIDSSGNLGIATSNPNAKLHVVGSFQADSTAGDNMFTSNANWNYTNLYLKRKQSNTGFAKMLAMGLDGDSSFDTVLTNQLNIWGSYSGTPTTGSTTVALNGVMNLGAPSGIAAHVNGSEALRVDSSRRLLVGTSSARSDFFNITNWTPQVQLEGTTDQTSAISLTCNNNSTSSPVLIFAKTRGTTVGADGLVSSGDLFGYIGFMGNDGAENVLGADIKAEVDGTPGANDMPGRLVFSTTADGASSPTERMRITNDGIFRINQTTSNEPAGDNIQGSALGSAGWGSFCRDSQTALFVGRKSDDGVLVRFLQDGTEEGNISVSGTTVSYNGAHLSRWSQLPGNAERTEILRGTVLSNIDEMCAWGEEDNEQLNRMKVSDVEGDPNVSGVFQGWDDDDDTYTDDFYCAMTGDFIIRIAEGVTVQRGDLLMSAGDGTAKPQDDDIIRSKTIAKVTSNHVTCTYDDGSYCVPCVLMAC